MVGDADDGRIAVEADPFMGFGVLQCTECHGSAFRLVVLISETPVRGARRLPAGVWKPVARLLFAMPARGAAGPPFRVAMMTGSMFPHAAFAHVAGVEQGRTPSCGRVLDQDPRVLDGHQEARERRHARAELDVTVIERCPLFHAAHRRSHYGFFPRSRKEIPEAGLCAAVSRGQALTCGAVYRGNRNHP